MTRQEAIDVITTLRTIADIERVVLRNNNKSCNFKELVDKAIETLKRCDCGCLTCTKWPCKKIEEM